MTGKVFFNGIANGKRDILECFLAILDSAGARYCVIGGLAVNAYVEPVVSLDLDIVIAAGGIEIVCQQAQAAGLTIERFAHSVNVASPESDLRIQLQTDPRYQDYLERAVSREVLGYHVQVACLEDVLQGKTWAYLDQTRRPSKRQKDLADILRLLETYPRLQPLLPEGVRRQIG